MRKTGKELIIKFRTGNTRSVRMTKKLKRLRVGQKLLIGWDYEYNCIANIWTEDELLHPEGVVPEGLESEADEKIYSAWVDIPI